MILVVKILLRGISAKFGIVVPNLVHRGVDVNLCGVGIVAVLCEHQGVRADGCCTAKAATHNLTGIVTINHPDEVVGCVLKRFEFGFNFLAREGR